MSFSRSISRDIRRQDIVLGMFVTVAVVLVIYLVLLNTYFQAQKSGWIRLHSNLGHSHGLVSGTIIELSGVSIGNVESVELLPDARVDIRILIDDQYHNLLRQDARLTVSSQIGIDTVISGVRLQLLPGTATGLLESNDRIEIVTPKGMDQILKDLKIELLVEQAQSIVGNLAVILGEAADNKGSIAAIMQNVEILSAQLADTSSHLPALLTQVDSTLVTLQASLNTIESSTTSLSEPATATMASIQTSLKTLDATLVGTQPALDRLPGVLHSLDQTLESIDELSRQLAGHWLLGGASKSADLNPVIPSMLPADTSLYEQ